MILQTLTNVCRLYKSEAKRIRIDRRYSNSPWKGSAATTVATPITDANESPQAAQPAEIKETIPAPIVM